ncbi:MAG: hypothetical protein ACREBR_00940 [bacterium]
MMVVDETDALRKAAIWSWNYSMVLTVWESVARESWEWTGSLLVAGWRIRLWRVPGRRGWMPSRWLEFMHVVMRPLGSFFRNSWICEVECLDAGTIKKTSETWDLW